MIATILNEDTCGGWTLYGDTTMVARLTVVLAEASRNVVAKLPSSPESRWTLISRDQGRLVGAWVASQYCCVGSS